MPMGTRRCHARPGTGRVPSRMRDSRAGEAHNDLPMAPHQTSGPDGGGAAAPQAVAVVRLPVDGTDWADNLPPVPAGHDVSVSFTETASWAHHGPVLDRLGYRVVDRAGDGSVGEWVDMVVYDDLPGAHPSWWRAVTTLADRVLPLAFGPAAMACADVLTAHGAVPRR